EATNFADKNDAAWDKTGTRDSFCAYKFFYCIGLNMAERVGFEPAQLHERRRNYQLECLVAMGVEPRELSPPPAARRGRVGSSARPPRTNRSASLCVANQIPDGARDVLDRHIRIDAMLVEQIGPIRPEPFQ